MYNVYYYITSSGTGNTAIITKMFSSQQMVCKECNVSDCCEAT